MVWMLRSYLLMDTSIYESERGVRENFSGYTTNHDQSWPIIPVKQKPVRTKATTVDDQR
jgi:hypothetical protein